MVLKIKWNDMSHHILELELLGLGCITAILLQELKDILSPGHVPTKSEAKVVKIVIFLVKD